MAVCAALLAAALGGCSDIYFDRRDSISVVSGEAMAANRVTQMIDPWPAASGRRNIAYNGERIQGAAERYRSHKIIQPVSPITSSASQAPPAITTEAVPGTGQNAQSAPTSSSIK